MRGQREQFFFEKNGRGEDEKSDCGLRMPHVPSGSYLPSVKESNRFCPI